MSRSPGANPLTTEPPILISPEVGLSSPASRRSAVLLPHPDGPTKIRNSPSPTVRFRPLRATTSPAYFRTTSRNSTSANVIPSTLDSGTGDRLDEVPLRADEHQQHRQQTHHVRRHQQWPLDPVGALKVAQPQRDR